MPLYFPFFSVETRSNQSGSDVEHEQEDYGLYPINHTGANCVFHSRPLRPFFEAEYTIKKTTLGS